MQKIECRVWDRAEERMFVPVEISVPEGWHIKESPSYIFMMKTGFVDSGGFPIYEGDILYDPSANQYCEVIEDDDEMGAFLLENYDDHYSESLGNGKLIVGNIYETPYILKE